MAEWLLPFHERNTDDPATTINFLWCHENIYVMDNHRAAAWCWDRHLDIAMGSLLHFFHVDGHDDTLWMAHYKEEHIPVIATLSLEQYLAFPDVYDPTHPNSLLFRHDNYLSLFMEKSRAKFTDKVIMSTHYNEPPRFPYRFADAEQSCYLLGNLWRTPGSWVVNVDLDYFTNTSESEALKRFVFKGHKRSVTRAFFTAIRDSLRAGAIRVLTIALSPTYAKGWRTAEELCGIACETLGLDFQLPTES